MYIYTYIHTHIQFAISGDAVLSWLSSEPIVCPSILLKVGQHYKRVTANELYTTQKNLQIHSLLKNFGKSIMETQLV